jgi:siroheme decarboxylase
MDSPYSPLDYALLNDWQRDFPLTERPFAQLAAKVGVGETAVLERLQHLRQRGAISRLGAVFAPRRAGASTLAALAAPPEHLEWIAALVTARIEVNHNYAREHAWNLWFVVTAPTQAILATTLAEIERDTGCPVISLPLVEEYHIDLGFNLGAGPRRRAGGGNATRPAGIPVARSAAELCILEQLETGLDLVARPYAELASRCHTSETEVLRHIAAWQQEGLIKRFGVVVRHHEVGFRANAMVVFALPEERVDTIGARLAGEEAVTLCYRRQPARPHWPYNLYCMIHGRTREEVAPTIERISALAGAVPEVLFSVHRFKQCGARYFAHTSTCRR